MNSNNTSVSRLVSIIVPAYNAESKIEQLLTSLTVQLYPHYEIIVVNDASTDNTEQVARDFLSRHNSNFFIINHEKNRGVSAARNTGIKAARGEYVCFADADDIVDGNFLSLLCDKAEKENRDALLLPCFSCHNLRHTFATRYCENENNIKVIQEILGHKDIATTMDVYAEATKDTKIKSFKELEGKIGYID